MTETDEAIRARIDAEWLDRGREIVARERDLNRSRDSLAWEMGDWANSLERSHVSGRMATGRGWPPSLRCLSAR